MEVGTIHTIEYVKVWKSRAISTILDQWMNCTETWRIWMIVWDAWVCCQQGGVGGAGYLSGWRCWVGCRPVITWMRTRPDNSALTWSLLTMISTRYFTLLNLFVSKIYICYKYFNLTWMSKAGLHIRNHNLLKFYWKSWMINWRCIISHKLIDTVGVLKVPW